MRSSRHREIIGLDIGVHSTKAVRAGVSCRGVRIRESERVRMPEDAAQRRDVLKALVEEKGWNGLPCIVSAPDDAVVLQTLSVPNASNRAMREAVLGEIEQLQEMSPGQTTHNWIRQGTDYSHVLLSAARLDSVMSAFEVAAAAGLEVVDVVSGTAAMHRAVTSIKQPGVPVCVDIGHEGCNVAIGPPGKIEFARHITSGYTRLGPDPEQATHETQVPDNSRLDDWAEELKHTLELHRTRLDNGASAPDRVVLCGGGARDAVLTSAIQEVVGLETRCYGSLGPSKELKEADVFATAVGLAIVGLGNAAICPSVLPPPMRERLTFRSQMKYWYATAIALVVAAAVTSFGLELKLRTRKAELALLESRLAEQHLLQKNLSLVQRLNSDMDTQIQPFRTAVHSGVMLRAVIHAIAFTKHPDDWIIMLADANAYGMANGGADDETRPERIDRVIVEGCTPDAELGTVRGMIDQLRERPGIVSVDLLSDDLLRSDPERDTRWAPTGARIFAIEVRVPEP